MRDIIPDWTLKNEANEAKEAEEARSMTPRLPRLLASLASGFLFRLSAGIGENTQISMIQ
jgi:hypothetical protein